MNSILRSKKDLAFYCFSPPVMVATFIIEIVGALYVLWRYVLNDIGRLVVITLTALATFQLAEYNVCGGYGIAAEHWSKVGYIAITLLPPLGLHIMYTILGRKNLNLVWLAYATMLGFIIYFLVLYNPFRGYECTGNYVIFQLKSYASFLYGMYYYGWLFIAMGIAIREAQLLYEATSQKYTYRRQALLGMVIGYLVFIFPTAVVNGLDPRTISGIPSIMCGFAVLFALILIFYVLPRCGIKKSI
jgi:hypothetical protein